MLSQDFPIPEQKHRISRTTNQPTGRAPVPVSISETRQTTTLDRTPAEKLWCSGSGDLWTWQ